MSEPGGPSRSSARPTARSLRNRVRYRFDRLLARGTWAVLLWLGAITFVVVVLSAVLLTAFGVTLAGSQDSSPLEDFWQSLLRVMDPGSMANDVGWGRRILALIVTLTGLLIAGTLIGLIAAGVEQRVERMRDGRSIVAETGHYVILGWSRRLQVLIEQLAAGDPGATVVVLADRTAATMDAELRPELDASLDHRLVFRSGDPRLRSGLELANIDKARAVIVLAGDDRNEGGVITCVLAMGRMVGFDRIPIVAEVASDDVRGKLLAVAGPNLHPVVVTEAATRSAALVLRQPGLSEVVEELVETATPGVHIASVDELAGATFAEAVFALDTARPIGLIGADGELRLNPSSATVIGDGDRLVVIDADHTVMATRAPGAIPPLLDPLDPDVEPVAMHLLFVGWNPLAPTLLTEFDRFATDGSSALVLADEPAAPAVPATSHFDVEWRTESDPATPIRDRTFTSIVLLAGGAADAGEVDAHTLLDLALVQRALIATGSLETQLLVQLQGTDRSALAEMAGLDGFVISDEIGSRLMAAFALRPERQPVFRTLYDPTHSSLHLLDLGELELGPAATFADAVGAAFQRRVCAIGVLTARDRGRRAVLAPPLSTHLDGADQIVVVG